MTVEPIPPARFKGMTAYVHSYDEDLRAAVGKLGAAIG
jgi:hypothetical protein